MIASIVVFVAGAAFSLREGIAELTEPVGASLFVAAYIALAISVVFDSMSLLQSSRQLRHEAHEFRRNFLDQVMLTSDPTVRAVFAEDVAAIAGDIIAIIGVAIHQASGYTSAEGIAAVLIGVLLIGVGFQLARRNRDFLLGEQAPRAVRQRITSFIVDYPGVVSIRELLVTFIGPRQLWVLARLDIDDDMRGDDVEALVRRIESGLREQSKYIGRVDVLPIGAATKLTPPS